MKRGDRWSLIMAIAALLAGSPVAEGQKGWQSRNQPVEPFRIAGNLYYVGASDIASYLIATSEGHIVIDGGFPETAPLIRDSIQQLGFELEDVEILLNSHAHFDHAGGLAALRQWTGAEVWVSEGDAAVVKSGGAGDYFLSAEDNSFPAVPVDRRLRDGEKVHLGDMSLTAHVTAGHTRGCTSWSFQVEEDGDVLDVVSICSLTILPGVELIGNAAFPDLVEVYERSLKVLEGLPCDIFLAAHASFFDMARKREAISEGGENPFIDPAGYKAYIEVSERRFRKRLAEQEKSAVEVEGLQSSGERE